METEQDPLVDRDGKSAFQRLEKEALSIIEQISNEKIPNLLSYRKGYRLMIIGYQLDNESFINQGKEYLKKFHINIKDFDTP